MSESSPDSKSFEVRFASLFIEGRAFAFPCNATGLVDLDSLSRRARDNYLYARALVGRDYSKPRICECLGTAA